MGGKVGRREKKKLNFREEGEISSKSREEGEIEIFTFPCKKHSSMVDQSFLMPGRQAHKCVSPV